MCGGVLPSIIDSIASSIRADLQFSRLFVSRKSFNNKEDAINKMLEWLEVNRCGKRQVNYKMRDWIFSRQRYWGCPIPVVYCDDCGVVPEKKENLPILLPTDVEFTGKGESPLTTSKTFMNATCPCCGNQDDSKMNVVGRLCGYLGQISSGNTNKGRLDDIYHREIHLDCAEEATL